MSDDLTLTMGEFVLWSCPKCGFAFDADHEDLVGGWSCPCCERDVAVARAERAEQDADRLADAIRAHGPFMDEGCEEVLAAHDALVAEREADQ